MNGSKGDHPITDILVHNIRVFSEDVDNLIKEICALGGEAEIDKSIDLFNPPSIDRLEHMLKKLRDKLKIDAKKRGWEVQ